MSRCSQKAHAYCRNENEKAHSLREIYNQFKTELLLQLISLQFTFTDVVFMGLVRGIAAKRQ